MAVLRQKLHYKRTHFGFTVLILGYIGSLYLFTKFFGDLLLPLFLLTTVMVGGVGFAWAAVKPKSVLLGMLFWSQFGVLLTKVLDTRIILYITYIMPLGLLSVILIKGLVYHNFRINLRIPIPKSAIVLAVTIFTGILMVQTFNPQVPRFEMAANSFFSKYFLHITAFILGVLLIKTKQDVKNILRVLTIGGALAAIYGLYQYFIGYPSFEDTWAATHAIQGVTVYEWEDRRVLSTLLYSATYGLFSVICLFQAIPLLTEARCKSVRLFYIGTIVLMTIGMFSSLTRGIWVAAVIGIGLWAFLKWRYFLRRIGISKIFLTMGLVISLSLLFEPIRYRLSTFKFAFSEQYDARFVGWLHFWLPKMSDWHFFTGYGLGLVGAGAERYLPFLTRFWHGHSGITDNLYITIFVSTGIVGLAAFLLLIWLTLRQSYRLGKKITDPFLQTFANTLFITFVTYYVAFLSADHLTDSYPANVYFWLLIAMLVKLPYLAKEEEENTIG